MRILVLESSTTSAKAAYYESPTAPIEVQIRRFKVESEDPAVRSAETIFAQTTELGRELLAGRAVDMIALGSTWHGFTLREPDLSARTPVYEWPFIGARNICAELRQDAQWTEEFYHRTGCMVNAIYPAFKALWAVNEGIDISGALLMDQGSLNFAFLTGKAWTSHSLVSGSGLYSGMSEDWDWELIRELGLEQIHFPELKHGTEYAALTADGAEKLGVSPGIPVLVPAPDGALNQVGDLAEEPGTMTFSMGTSGALRLAVPKPLTSPDLSTWSYRAPTTWLSGAATSGCCNCTDWARERFFEKTTPFAQIEAQLAGIKKNGPIFMPFLFGERCPGWQDQRLGGFHQVSGNHNQYDLYNAVLTGVTYNLYQCYQNLVSLNGVPKKIRLSGGVLYSPHWKQTVADVFQREMEISILQHTSIVGALRMALRSLGENDQPPTLGDTAGTQLITPNPNAYQAHQNDYARYLQIYQQTNPEGK